jgi:glycerophosphoryl diester phosphodiesterase
VRLGDAARPLVIGHRGAPLLAPENTIASFEAAVAAGADAVELDVGRGLVVAHSEHEVPEQPLSLDEALAFLRERLVAPLVDLKQRGIEPDVAAAVARHGLRRQTIVSSTSRRALRRLEAADPGLTRAIAYPYDRFRISRLDWPDAVGARSSRRASSRRHAPAERPSWPGP